MRSPPPKPAGDRVRKHGRAGFRGAMTLTLERARAVLADHGGYLDGGAHDGSPGCRLCSSELHYLITVGEVRDHPATGDTPTDAARRALNDARWPSAAERTEHCLPLALLADARAAPGWVEQYAIATVARVLPLALRAAGLDGHADACAAVRTLDAARAAAAAAAADDAAYAAYAAYAATATRAATRAAADTTSTAYAAYAAAHNAAALEISCRLLIACHRGEDWTAIA